MALKAECSSIYNKGRILTTEQTKMMISGITQSLNSGFAPSLSPNLNSGLSQGLSPSLTSSSLTSGLSSGFSPRVTPAITPAYTPGFPPRLIQSYITGVDTGALQTLKLTQIRKPLMKSAFIDQNLTEEEVNMKFVQDLLRWVDEMQVTSWRCVWSSSALDHFFLFIQWIKFNFLNHSFNRYSLTELNGVQICQVLKAMLKITRMFTKLLKNLNQVLKKQKSVRYSIKTPGDCTYFKNMHRF